MAFVIPAVIAAASAAASATAAAIPAGMATAGGMAAGVGTAGAVGGGSLLANAALLTSAVGAVGSTLSGVQQARGQARAATAEAKSIRQQSAFEEQQYRRTARMAIGQQVATGAASGVDITSGSPLFMELDSIRQAELEALNIRQQGKYGAASKRFEARMAKSRIPGIIMGGAAGVGQGLTAGGNNSILSQWTRR